MQTQPNQALLSTSYIEPHRLATVLQSFRQVLIQHAQSAGSSGDWARALAAEEEPGSGLHNATAVLLALADWLTEQGITLEPDIRCGLRRAHYYLRGSLSIRLVLDHYPLNLDAEEQQAGLTYHAYACVSTCTDLQSAGIYRLEGFVLHNTLRFVPGSAGLWITGKMLPGAQAAIAQLRRQGQPRPLHRANWFSRLRQQREWRMLLRSAIAEAQRLDPALRQQLDATKRALRPMPVTRLNRWVLSSAVILLLACLVLIPLIVRRDLRSSPKVLPTITAMLKHASSATNSEAAELESALVQEDSAGQLLRLLAGEPLPPDPHGAPLTDSNVSVRAYPQADGGVEVLILRGTVVDGYRLSQSQDQPNVVQHWTADLWDTAESCVGPLGVDQAKEYFAEQERQTLASDASNKTIRKAPSEWSRYSPGGHAKLHPAVDFNGDGELEYPVSMMATLHFLSAEGKVEASWAAPQKLTGWIYDDAQFFDLDGDRLPEAVLSVATAYKCEIQGVINQRGLAVCSAAGALHHLLPLATYPLLSPVADYSGSGKPELFLTCDVPGNGYTATVNYHGQPMELTDQSGLIALVTFNGLEPVLEWLAQPPEFNVPAGSAVKRLAADPSGRQWFWISHYSGGDVPPYDEMYLFDRPEIAKICTGKTPSLVRFPQATEELRMGMPAIVSSEEPASFLLCQPPRLSQPGAVILKDANLGAKPLRAADLPPSYRQPVVTVLPDGAGGVLALAWDTSVSCEPRLFSAANHALAEVQLAPAPVWSQPVRSVTPVMKSSNQSLLLVVTDRLEFWDLSWQFR